MQIYSICKKFGFFEYFHGFEPTLKSVGTWNQKSICGKVFKSGLSKFCGRHPLKNFKGTGLLKGELSGRIT